MGRELGYGQGIDFFKDMIKTNSNRVLVRLFKALYQDIFNLQLVLNIVSTRCLKS